MAIMHSLVCSLPFWLFCDQGLTTISRRELRSVNQHVRMWDENFMVQVRCIAAQWWGEMSIGRVVHVVYVELVSLM